MKFSDSLKKNDDFKNVYKNGKSYANKYLVMYVLKNGLEENRFGITVSKKVGKSVVRSRVTRRIRESYRLSEKEIAKGYDIVIIARVFANGASFQEIDHSLKHLLKKHNLLLKSEEKEEQR